MKKSFFKMLFCFGIVCLPIGVFGDEATSKSFDLFATCSIKKDTTTTGIQSFELFVAEGDISAFLSTATKQSKVSGFISTTSLLENTKTMHKSLTPVTITLNRIKRALLFSAETPNGNVQYQTYVTNDPGYDARSGTVCDESGCYAFDCSGE